MIKSKERILKHQYNRNNRIKDVTIIGMNIIEPHTHELELLGEHIAKRMSVEITVCPPHRIFNLDEFIEEKPEIYQQLYKAEFKDIPIWTFYEYLRAYHVIEIIIGFLITMGVYLWLK